MMDGSYVPPFRRRQAAGGSGDVPLAKHIPNNHSYRGTRNNGDGQGRRGYGRRGRGESQTDFFQKQRPELYYPRDIHNYFWGSVDATRDATSSTFHDSKDRSGQLSHVMLFFGANPRWANDHIVFAKSKLELLPEYAAKKTENGEWETEKVHRNAIATCGSVEDDLPKTKDITASPTELEDETVAQSGELVSAEARDSSYPTAQKPNDLTNEPNDEKDRTTSSSTTDFGGKDDRPHVKQETTQDCDQASAQGLSTWAQELHSTDKPSDNGVERAALKGNTQCERPGDQYAAAEIERVADNTAQASPILTPSPKLTSSRLKYTDIRKEGAEAFLELNQFTTLESYTKNADIRIIPANQFYKKDEPFPPEAVFPAIAPIDYVPASPLPIAIFEEQRIPGLRTGGIHARFAFKGWFKISRVNILAPHSAELVRMLQQKWERKDRFGNVIPTKQRDATAWDTSLSIEWAVIAFQPWEGDGALPPPQIERLPVPERPASKSVNEMLSDMRLNDGNSDGQKEDKRSTVKLGEDEVAYEFKSNENHVAKE